MATFTTEPAKVPTSIILRELYGISQREANELRASLIRRGVTPRQIRTLSIPPEKLPEKYRGTERVTRQLRSLIEAEQTKTYEVNRLEEGLITTKAGTTVQVKQNVKPSYERLQELTAGKEPEKKTVYIAIDRAAVENLNKQLPPGELQRQLFSGEAEIKDGQLYYTVPSSAKTPKKPKPRFYGATEYFQDILNKGIHETEASYINKFRPSGMSGVVELNPAPEPGIITGPAKVIYGGAGAVLSRIFEPVIYSVFEKPPEVSDIGDKNLRETQEAQKQFNEKISEGQLQLGFLASGLTDIRPSPGVVANWFEQDTAEAWAGITKGRPYKKPTDSIVLPDATLGLTKQAEIQSLLKPREKIFIELKETNIIPKLETYLPEQHIRLAIQKQALKSESLKVSLFAPEEYTPMDFLELARQKPELAKSFMEETGQTSLTKDYFNKIIEGKTPRGERLKSVLDEIQTELAREKAEGRIQVLKKEVSLEQIKPGETQLKLVEAAPEVFKSKPGTVEVEPVLFEVKGKKILVLGKKGQADPRAVFSKFQKEKLETFSKLGEALKTGQLKSPFSAIGEVLSKPRPPPYEEVYIPVAVLPYWKDIKPIESLTQRNYTLNLPDISSQALKSDIYYSTKLVNLQELTPTLALTQASKYELLSKTAQKQLQKLTQTQVQTQALTQAQALTQVQVQVQVQDLATLQKQIQTQFITPRQFVRLTPVRPGEATTPGPPPPPPIPPVVPPPFKFSLPGSQARPGFEVFIRKGGVFKKISKEPLIREEAINFGAFRVEHTAAASFKIKPTGKPATGSFRGLINVFDRFYKSTREEGEIFIEKPRYRISTPGELREITLKGILTKKHKNIFGSTKKKKNIFKNVFAR